jgi:hypothetical protein
VAQYDEKREESEREVIEATQLMINERIPAIAAELDKLDTSRFDFLYSRHRMRPLSLPLFLCSAWCVSCVCGLAFCMRTHARLSC